jgi:hypothetical protein
MAVKEPTPRELVDRLARAEDSLREASADLEEIREAVVELIDRSAPGDVPADMLRLVAPGISADALEAFLDTLAQVMGEKTLSVADARRAALLAASATAWENELGPLLTSAQVRTVLNGVSRQWISELVRDHRLIGLGERSGRTVFPAFQFDAGQPLTELVEAFWTVAAHASPWTAASWCVAGDDALDDRSPVAWAREGRSRDVLLRVAAQDAARLAG